MISFTKKLKVNNPEERHFLFIFEQSTL